MKAPAFFGLLPMLLLLSAGSGEAQDSKPTSKPTSRAVRKSTIHKQLEKVFTELKKALEEKDEKLFRSRWVKEGYEKNLVGGSGIPGEGVFKQGSRKGWYLKAAVGELKSIDGGKAYIIPCQIWSTKKDKAVDKVWAAVVISDGAWKILGAGEKDKEVEALMSRFMKKEPLAPK